MASIYDFEVSNDAPATNNLPRAEDNASDSEDISGAIYDETYNDGSDIDDVSPAPSEEESADEEDMNIDLGRTCDKYLPTWTRDFQPVEVPYFTHPTEHKLPEDFDLHEATPLDYFKLFFTDKLIGDIARYTNDYASWCIQSKGEEFVDPNWNRNGTDNTTLEEMKAYLGILLICGTNPIHRYQHYWSKDPFLKNPGIMGVLSRTRFEKLSQYFHVSDRRNEPAKGTPQFDRLYKVRPVMEAMTDLFPKYKHPAPSQTIDEGMIAFKGRVSYLQYMPDKPCKRGVKVFIRCDSETGYMHRFEIYLGKSRTVGPQGLYFDVIDNLTKDIRWKNHRLYTDNLYTAITLWKHLYMHGIYATGTIRAGRKGLPPEVNKPSKKMLRGEHITFQDANLRNLTASVWCDNRIVRYCSTMAKPDLRTSTVRRIGATYHTLGQPHAGTLYARHMGGVDRFDQLRAKYRIGRFSKKCWKYLFNFFANSAVVNSWLLYQQYSKREIKKKGYEQLDFRLELAKELIGGYSDRKATATCVYVGPLDPVNVAAHTNTRMPGKWSRQCYAHAHFYGARIRRRTAFGCQQCNLYLCKDCHHFFHNS